MLVLSRKQNQEIIIGDNIKITVVKMKGNTVRLGIEAPREVNVRRGELLRHESPKNESTKNEFANPAGPQAEMTVVFSNHEGNKHPSTNRELFTSVKTNSSLTGRDRQLSKSPTTPPPEAHSLRFRGNLPTQLQHNRLKEIVDQLTAKASTQPLQQRR